MKRRAFMQTVGAIASATVLPEIRTVNAIDLDLIKRFCDSDIQRYSLAEPFVQTEFCYATDARCALQLFDAGRYAGDSAGKLPDADGIFADSWKSGKWQPWPELDCVRDDSEFWEGQCPFCNPAWIECPRCEGEGYLFGPDPRMDVKTCQNKFCDEGYVRKRCDKCMAGGLYHYQQLDGRRIMPIYSHLVSQLPNVEFIEDSDTESVISFRFDGGRGLLMPKTQQKER